MTDVHLRQESRSGGSRLMSDVVVQEMKMVPSASGSNDLLTEKEEQVLAGIPKSALFISTTSTALNNNNDHRGRQSLPGGDQMEDTSEMLLEQALEPIYVRTFTAGNDSDEEEEDDDDLNEDEAQHSFSTFQTDLKEQIIQESEAAAAAAATLGSSPYPHHAIVSRSLAPESQKMRSLVIAEEELDRDDDSMDIEGGSVDDLNDEDDEEEEEESRMITFDANNSSSSSPTIFAKFFPNTRNSTPPTAVSVNSNERIETSGRMTGLRRNANLTLNLSSNNQLTNGGDSSASPTMGRFKVTTLATKEVSEVDNASLPVAQSPVPPPPPPTTQQLQPPPKDERQLTPYERLQMYADNVALSCRNGVAVQYVNFIRDADDPDAFVSMTARLFERLTQDNDLSVRLAMLEQVANIVRSYKPAFKRLRIMSFLGESVRDDNYNVRRMAQIAIGQLIEFAPELMTREVIQASLVPLLIQMFYADFVADLTIDALNLFCKLLDRVGPDPVRRLFMPEFNKLCGHEVAQIRQVCAQNLPLVVKYFTVTQGDEFSETEEACRMVQERIVGLAQDLAWHVRESVAITFPQIIDLAHHTWPHFAHRQLYTAYLNLLNDQAKQVRRCATRGLGRVIASSADPSKTRLQITSSGTVEFLPPPSFPFVRLSESESEDHRASPLLSEGDNHNHRHRPSRSTNLPSTRPSTHPSSTTHNNNNNNYNNFVQNFGHPRRNYYNRLGITSLTQALNEADMSRKEEVPDYNSFQWVIGDLWRQVGTLQQLVLATCSSRFWQNPLPEVSVSVQDNDQIVLVLSPPVITTSAAVHEKAEPGIELPSMDDELDLVVEHADEEIVKDELEKMITFAEIATEEAEVVVQQQQQQSQRRLLSEQDTTKEAVVVVVPDIILSAETGSVDDQDDDDVDRPDLVSNGPALVDASLLPQDESESVIRSTPDSVGKKGSLSDADETHSVSSASEELPSNVNHHLPAVHNNGLFGSTYDVEAFVIDKYKRRDKAVLTQLRDAGEIAGKLEDILPNVIFLREFVQLARDSDRETVIQTAIDFPAVALTVGRQFWPDIQECHRTLASCNIIQARELVAASLPRIAEIIGYYYTVVHLVPLIGEFLKDTDVVRLAMIENYSSFIMRLPAEIRPVHLLRLCEFFTPDEERNWRYRYACAEQIAHLALLFPPKLVVRNLMDGAWFFARDRTSEVRRSACLALSSIFQRIEQQRDVHSRGIFIQKLELFLRNGDFRSRQVFAQICEDLLSKASVSFEAFSSYFGERFWPLFDDNVVAVRLAAARCLLHMPQKHSHYNRAMEYLQKDGSRTIQEVYVQIVANST